MADARITLLTPRGRGAVATLQFCGPSEILEAFFRPANGKPLSAHAVNRIVYGQWGKNIPEDVVVCRVDEMATEIHCHGGDAAAARIQADLQTLGARQTVWRDEIEQSQGVFQREWTECLGQATTTKTAEFLLRQGTLFPNAIRDLVGLLDSGKLIAAQTRMTEMLKWWDFARHLTEPWRVVLSGPPNVGKSSLINALLGYARAIVFDQPGTTRDVVTAETAYDGWPIQFADTAGLRDGAEPLEAEGISRARERLKNADCRVLLFDQSRPLTDLDRKLQAEFPDAIFVAHKSDLPSVSSHGKARRVSSVTGASVEELLREIAARLVPEPPPTDQALPFTARQNDRLIEARAAIARSDKVETQTVLRQILGKG